VRLLLAAVESDFTFEFAHDAVQGFMVFVEKFLVVTAALVGCALLGKGFGKFAEDASLSAHGFVEEVWDVLFEEGEIYSVFGEGPVSSA
jgi:hypothetical protein